MIEKMSYTSGKIYNHPIHVSILLLFVEKLARKPKERN